MQEVPANLFTRSDTFFGVCEGIGEDLRIPPNLLRVALAGLAFWNPLVAAGTYACAALLVALTRWLIPNPCPVVQTEEVSPAPAENSTTSLDTEPALPLAA